MSSCFNRSTAHAREFGIPSPITTLQDRFAARLDAVDIATHNERHRSETEAAAAAGMHVRSQIHGRW
jgi:1,5-anhydro-D-fructose reductase (1,5-anhydro-D-mannitol-forming)